MIVPTYYAKNIFEIPLDFYLKNNFLYILIDLDNTLDPYYKKEPSDKVIKLCIELKKNNINLVIFSNNSKKRVSYYSSFLNINYIYRSFKPFSKKLNNFIYNNKINKENCIIIGDQLLTDIKCAKKAHIKSILVDELEKKNALCSKLNKFIEKRIRKKLKRKNLLNNLEV